MKARLYRGPHDGRVMTVPDHQRSITLKRKGRMEVFKMPSSDGFMTIPTFDDEYRIVYVAYSDDQGRIRSGFSIHPDGSVFFEWTKKRGTPIER